MYKGHMDKDKGGTFKGEAGMNGVGEHDGVKMETTLLEQQ